MILQAAVDVKVVFLAHRVEFLDLFIKEMNGCDVVVLEEPRDGALEMFLENQITIEDYVENSGTGFPVYTFHQALALKDLYSRGVRIIQVEPYLEILEKIYRAISAGRVEEYSLDPGAAEVLEVEKEVTGALIEYHEELMGGDFDRIVDKIIEFAKRDAKRFVVRDRLRAEAISRLELDGMVGVEAGYMHILLPRYLEERGVKTSTVSLIDEACRMLGLHPRENPGDTLTKSYMLNEDLGGEERLKAAQSLIYLMLVSREEKTPTLGNPFPHLTEEIGILERITKMSYDECRELYERMMAGRLKSS